MKSGKPAKQNPPAPKGLILRDVPGKGRGVFTTRAFQQGEEVLQFLGEIVDVSEAGDLTHYLQIGPKTFLTPSNNIDDYVNHACEPNTGIRDDRGRIVLFALEPLAKGDEITFDYATTQTGGFWEMSCACGAASCRGSIGDYADVPPARQAYYELHQAVLPFLLAKAK